MNEMKIKFKDKKSKLMFIAMLFDAENRSCHLGGICKPVDANMLEIFKKEVKKE